MDIVHIETGLDYVVRDVSVFASGMALLEKRPGAAIWKVTEHTVIKAWAKSETTTELMKDSSISVDAEATQAWLKLLDKLRRNGISVIPCGAMDSERAVQEALATFRPNRREDYPAWEAERAARATKTIEQVAAEFFASLEAESTPSAALGTEQGAAYWRGTGERPKNRAEKILAMKAWDNLDRWTRPSLPEWLEDNFGLNADGSLAVAESTFYDACLIRVYPPCHVYQSSHTILCNPHRLQSRKPPTIPPYIALLRQLSDNRFGSMSSCAGHGPRVPFIAVAMTCATCAKSV